jgi:hypothetical protein
MAELGCVCPGALGGLTITGGNGDNAWGVDGNSIGATRPNPITLNTGTLHDVVNVFGTDAADPVTVNTGNALGSDVVNVGSNHRLDFIAGPLTINNAHGAAKVSIDDSLNSTSHANVVLSGTSLTGLAPGPINFGPNALAGLTITEGSGNNTFTVANTPASTVPGGDPVVLHTGSGVNTNTILGTAVTAPLIFASGGAHDVVNVGNGTVAGINGALTLINVVPFFPQSFQLNINDGNDNTDHPNVVLSDGFFNQVVSNGVILGITDSSLTGLAPVAITFESIDVKPMSITLGNGNNTFTINDTSFGAPATTLNTGNGHDVINVQGLEFTGPLTINAGSGNDVVNVGKGGSLAAINADLTINAAAGAAQVNVNDGADNANHANVVLTATSLSGLSAARFGSPVIHFGPNALAGLNISVGNGTNTYTIVDTPPSTAAGGDPVVLNTGNGNDAVTIRATERTAPLSVNLGSGVDTVNVGSAANTLDPIQGPVTVHGGGGADTLSINDQGSTTPHTYQQALTTLDRSGAARITFLGIANLHLNKGPVLGPMLTDLSLPKTIEAGDSATLKGRLVGPDRHETLTLVVDWGDGSQPETVRPGQEPFALHHRYQRPGSYTVHLVWSDSAGHANSEELRLSVTKDD